ncbi:bifunctional heptose 7-phosphate kinase/heptose 1-phosphate adenyltransferase [Carboxylicivirga taeanensis]|uniref:bifunctional heptose 7-phosphate kinase/heptose 1-phosphate adenyltransferase n=1 Tax=Carboxylicivirga taeanensis TaxID=1416875 RepID=UPI003F6E415A
MNSKNISDLFDSFNTMNVLVIGDVMIDTYIRGKVNRISPEAPVPIVAITDQKEKLGGAANVALNLKSLGANPILCSAIGCDSGGETFIQLLKDSDLTHEGIIQDKSRKTTVKTRIQSDFHHLIRLDSEELSEVNSELEQLLISRICNYINTNTINAIIFEDYDKGVITPKLIQSITTVAKQCKVPILTDPKKRNFEHYQNIAFFKPNLREFREGLNLIDEPLSNQLLLNKSQEYIRDKEMACIMVTMAEKGVMIVTPDEHHFITAEVREIADVSGAGDTVISLSALCLAAGCSPKVLAQIANMAGGLVCEHPSIIAIDKETLKTECINKLVYA